jgi:hypothetical protein
LKVVGLGKDEVLIVVLAPEVRVGGKCPQRGINHERREPVESLVEHIRRARRVLIGAVPEFDCLSASKCRNKHAVEVHEPELATADEHIAVLEVSVRDPREFQLRDDAQPFLCEKADDVTLGHDLAQVNVESVTAQPFHHENGVLCARDPNTSGVVVEPNDQRKLHLVQVCVDSFVALLSVRNLSTEATHGLTAIAVHELEDTGKVAGGHDRHAMPVHRRH